MGNFTRRGSAALLAVGALVLTPLTATADDDSELINWDGAPEIDPEYGPQIHRFASYDRVATSIEAAARADDMWGADSANYPAWADQKIAIIATTMDFSDALAAAPLADELNAPVLLSGGPDIDKRVLAHLEAYNFDGVIVAGGNDVFNEASVKALQAQGLWVDRAEGANRYQTAIMLAGGAIMTDAYEEERDLDNANVFLASGEDFPDALAAGAAAANHSGVVLLTRGDKGLDSQTYAAVTNWTNPDFDFDTWWGPTNHAMTIAVGGPAEDAAAAGWQSDPIEVNDSVVGRDRYETAVLLAQDYVADASNVTLASGENYPDAVVGGAFAANVDGPLLLTQHSNLPRVVENYFMADGVREQVEHVIVFGGNNSVAPSVSWEIVNLPWDY